MLDIIALIFCAADISRRTSCSWSGYCLFLKLSYYWIHMLWFIQQNIYGQTVTMVSFCRSEQKFNTASALQFWDILWMYLNDRKNMAYSVSYIKQTTNKQAKSVKGVFDIFHKKITVDDQKTPSLTKSLSIV